MAEGFECQVNECFIHRVLTVCGWDLKVTLEQVKRGLVRFCPRVGNSGELHIETGGESRGWGTWG